ncbi:restriction endonuclease subunit S [Elizabethkingia anophelis]|uniref:restriction endonuclease subunit S n=1 Tax=Elizabethkingia anophelis TaxID=1117645 RepID=UPI0038917B5A
MSYLEKLLDITDIEWKSLEEIASFRRGSFPQPYGNHEWYDGEGSMPFVQVIDVNNNLQLVNNTKKKISKLAQHKSVFVPKDTVIVTLQGSIGRVAITQYDCYIDRTLAVFEHFLIKVNKKYFAYQLEEKFKIEKETARGNIIKTITKEDFKKFLIPIPCPDNQKKSLEIQQKIVDILDKFTELRTKLIKELTTELTARKQQYNYYREQLFTFDGNEVQHLPMGDESIGEFQRGKRFVKTDLLTEGVPTIHYGEMYTHYGTWADTTKSFVSEELVKNKNLRVAQKGDVVIVAAGETIEDIGQGTAWLGDKGVVIHDACFSYKTILNPKFVAYFTRTKQFHDQIKKYISSGKISAINSKGLGKAIIPIPSPEEQERIVSILDKFDILTNSISKGLPKEIELRQKQYEYYRDMLLTFPKDNIEA